MADTYSNPFGALPMDNNNSPWSGLMGNFSQGFNRAVAMPQVNIANEGARQELLKKQMETGEFTSPQAQATRQSKLRFDEALNNANLKALPFKTDKDINQYVQEQRERIPQADATIAQAHATIRKLEGTPYGNLMTNLTTNMPQFDKAGSDDERNTQLTGILEQWERENPGMKVPDQFRKWNPDLESHLRAAHVSALYTPEFRAKMAELEKTGETQKGVATIGAEGRMNVALLHQQLMMHQQKFETMLSDLERTHRQGEPWQPHEIESYKRIQQVIMNMKAAASGLDPTGLRTFLLNSKGGDIPIPTRQTPTPVSPPAGAQPAAGGDMKGEVERRGQTYEPDKFDYRVNENGELQRKPK